MSEGKTRDEAAVKIACIQMEPVVGKKDHNVNRSLEFIEKAAAQGARLIVLPELCHAFQQRFSAVLVSIHEGDQEHMIDRLRRG